MENSKGPDQSLQTSRRTALKKMAAATGIIAGSAALPEKWIKPVVDRILVPAHAQTSPLGDRYYSGNINIDEQTKIFEKSLNDDGQLADRFASLLIPKAHAGTKGDTQSKLCLFVDNEDNFTAQLYYGGGLAPCHDATFNLPAPGGTVSGGPVAFNELCDGDPVFIAVTSADEGEAAYAITGALEEAGTIDRADSAEDCEIVA